MSSTGEYPRDGKTKYSKTKYTRDAHTIRSNNKKLFHTAQRTSYRHGRRYETAVHVILSSPPPPAYRGTHALARTHGAYDTYGRSVQWVKHLRPLPCDKAAAIPPRRGCSTARVQHPAVEISETGLGDAPPERDPYTIKIARVEATRTSTIILQLLRLQLLQW